MWKARRRNYSLYAQSIAESRRNITTDSPGPDCDSLALAILETRTPRHRKPLLILLKFRHATFLDSGNCREKYW